jgi:vitamin K-dependent gamma-carboxylase
LLWPRSRPCAYLTVLLFHGLTSALFPIGMFPVIMMLGALVFFPPDWPRALLKRVGVRFAPASAGEAPKFQVSRPALLLLALYCFVQVAWPLRFLAYGGDVRWHEQGMRFSWRVMVREKNGSVTFRVRQKQTGRVVFVSPDAYLTRQQVREMASQPDLILQFAHFLRDRLTPQLGPVSITVDAQVAMNGRRQHPLIDPEADLAAISDGLAKAGWILPAPTERPVAIRPI